MKDMTKYLSGLILLMFAFTIARAQSIVYSIPDEEDTRTNSYEIVGKLNGHFIIYKNSHGTSFFNIYSADMRVIGKKTLPDIPSEIIATNFITYSDEFMLFFQYQKKNILYLKLLKFNQNAEPVGDVTDVDTSLVESNTADPKTFKILVSENKQQIMTFKLNKLDKITYRFNSILFNKSCAVQHISKGILHTVGKNEFFSEFILDNDGNLAALWQTGTMQNDNISSVTIMVKKSTADTLSFCPVAFSGIYLDDVKLKIDNINHHYLVTSFFSKQKRGNVDGLYFYFCDANTLQNISTKHVLFSDDLRNNTKGEHSTKEAFNDFYLKNIVFNQTGGFLILTESEYTSSKSNNMYNRWDNMNNSLYSYNSPYYDPFYSPYYNTRNQVTRYLSDDIVLFSFDEKGNIIWSNTIVKTQYDDLNNKSISYGLVNTGEELHFMYNLHERSTQLLNQTSLTTEGKILYNSTPMRSLDQGYDFLPRLSKQVGRKQIIVPCLYGNITCFAKIEFN